MGMPRSEGSQEGEGGINRVRAEKVEVVGDRDGTAATEQKKTYKLSRSPPSPYLAHP
jgi:hypothetical protein